MSTHSYNRMKSNWDAKRHGSSTSHMTKDSLPVEFIDLVPVKEWQRSEKAVLLWCDGTTAWFPMKALIWDGIGYLIADWLKIEEHSKQDHFLINVKLAKKKIREAEAAAEAAE